LIFPGEWVPIHADSAIWWVVSAPRALLYGGARPDGGIAMSKNALTYGFVGLLSMSLVAVGVTKVYAHCGKCLTDAKYFAGALDESKLTLAAASTIAEVETKGTAVHATVQRIDEGVNIEVHCLADGKIMAVVVDGQSGKVLGSSQVTDLEGHASL
jgi:hypothetical protein